MAVQSVGSVVNSSFIRSFQGLAGSDGPAIGAGAGKGASIASGLRLGARTFATAIQNLNSTIGIVNVADDTLKKLSTITDKMLAVVERATSLSAGTETRRGLQGEFEDLVNKFRGIVDKSELSGIEYLTEEGLSSLFQRIGLDRDSSDGVAAVFKKFIKANDDDVLASENTKGKRPPEVPVLKRSRVAKVSDSGVFSGYSGTSPDFSVYTDTNGLAVNQPYNVSQTGVVTTQSGVTFTQKVLAVNESKGSSGESTGYSVISSTQDLIGLSPEEGYEQVFVVSPQGDVIRQVTNVTQPDVYNFQADISADNKVTAVYYTDDNQSPVNNIEIRSVSNIADTYASSTLVESFSTSGYPVKITISNDGDYLAYRDDENNTVIRHISDSSDNYLSAAFPDISDFYFADSDTIIFHDSNSGGIYSYAFNSSAPQLLLTDSSISKIAVLENDSTYSDNDGLPSNTPKIANIAYTTLSGSDNRLTVLSYDLNSETLKTRYRRDLGSGTVDQITMAYQNDGNTTKDRVDVGVVGTLTALYGDSDTEMYRVSESRFASNNSLFSQASSDPTTIFDGNVLTRADAYRLFGDLKALKQQITDNQKALSDARDYLAQGVSFIRKAGFAFLDISNQIDGSEDANEVAQLVATEIRKNASTAELAQVENLRNIATETVGLLG